MDFRPQNKSHGFNIFLPNIKDNFSYYLISLPKICCNILLLCYYTVNDICEGFGSPAVKYIKPQTNIRLKKVFYCVSRSPSWKTFFIFWQISSFCIFQNGIILQKCGWPPSTFLTIILIFTLFIIATKP